VHGRKLKKAILAAERSLRFHAKALHSDLRLRERFLTLTVPHCGAGAVHGRKGTTELRAVERRIAVLYEAWAIFCRSMREMMLEQLPARNHAKLADLCHFFRVFEWKEGSDGDGHPHFHLWLHSPFLRHELIQAAWKEALETVMGETVQDPIVDIRLVSMAGNVRADGRKTRVVDELIKYMIKDFSDRDRGRFVNPVTYAAVLIAMTGRRSRQTSAGLSAHIAACVQTERDMHCRVCGVVGAMEHRVVPDSLVRWSCDTGPPSIGGPRFFRTIEVREFPPPPPQASFQI
jgi:hypothetical protein